jgi:hypothetical protein
MRDKLTSQRRTTARNDIVGANVATPCVTKSCNISATNQASSSEVVAMKEINDIGIDARTAVVCTKSSDQPVGFGADTVGASSNSEI